jgi:hypothetical protein
MTAKVACVAAAMKLRWFPVDPLRPVASDRFPEE